MAKYNAIFYLLICSFTIIFIKGVDGRKCKTKEDIDIGVMHCLPNYYQVHADPITCITIKAHGETYYDARIICARDPESVLFSPVNKETIVYVANYFPGIRERPWIGLNDIKVENSWEWENGLPLGATFWHPSEPDGMRDENCAFNDNVEGNKWIDDRCNTNRGYICQRLSTIGPRQLEMEIKWHRDNVFYTNLFAMVTCSAFSPVDGKINWVISDRNTFDMPIVKNVTHEKVAALNSLNVCAYKTISTLRFIITTPSDDIKVTCYPREIERVRMGHKEIHDVCPDGANELAFCKRSKALKFLQGPDGPAQIKVTYLRAPGPSELVKAECKSTKSEVFTPYFSVNFPVDILSSKNHLEGTNNESIVMTLIFTMEERIDGVTISCFVDDVKKKKLGLVCNPSKDAMCSLSSPLVYSKFPQAPSVAAGYAKVTEIVRINYHRRDKTLYLHLPLTAVCIGIDAIDNRIEWRLVKADRRLTSLSTVPHTIKTSSKNVSGHTHVTSILRLNVTIYLDQVSLTCYSNFYRAKYACPTKDKNPLFCDYTGLLQTIEGPFAKPKLEVAYKGYPEVPKANTTIHVHCEVHTGIHGTLLWVVYTKRRMFVAEGKIIKEYLIKPDKDGNSLISSTLEFPLTRQNNGIKVACFGYNVRKYGINGTLACIEKEDEFCTMTHAIEVFGDEPKVFAKTDAITPILIPALLTAAVILVCGFMYATFFKSKQSSTESLVTIETEKPHADLVESDEDLKIFFEGNYQSSAKQSLQSNAEKRSTATIASNVKSTKSSHRPEPEAAKSMF